MIFILNNNNSAPANRTRWNLSSNISFRMLHSLRARNDGVLIGIKTLLADDPQLNVRVQLDGSEIPHATTRPIVIDSHLSVLQLHPSQIRTARPIVCTSVVPSDPKYILAQAKMAELGGSLVSCAIDESGR